MKYDLETRTKQFSKRLINLIYSIKTDIVTKPIKEQLIRSGTSIGANYAEANGSSSKRDFRNKIHICKKEAKETLYWLDLLEYSIESINYSSQVCSEIRQLKKEAKELSMIFNKISWSLKNKAG